MRFYSANKKVAKYANRTFRTFGIFCFRTIFDGGNIFFVTVEAYDGDKACVRVAPIGWKEDKPRLELTKEILLEDVDEVWLGAGCWDGTKMDVNSTLYSFNAGNTCLIVQGQKVTCVTTSVGQFSLHATPNEHIVQYYSCIGNGSPYGYIQSSAGVYGVSSITTTPENAGIVCFVPNVFTTEFDDDLFDHPLKTYKTIKWKTLLIHQEL